MHLKLLSLNRVLAGRQVGKQCNDKFSIRPFRAACRGSSSRPELNPFRLRFGFPSRNGSTLEARRSRQDQSCCPGRLVHLASMRDSQERAILPPTLPALPTQRQLAGAWQESRLSALAAMHEQVVAEGLRSFSH